LAHLRSDHGTERSLCWGASSDQEAYE
jgi:hypothetical protein